eukprot:scaffold198732_cov17-Tisochrysis_lutea.AAC.2
MRGPRCIACPRAQHPTQLQGSHFGWAAASVTTKAHRTWSPVTIAVRMDAACRCAMVGALSGLSLKKGHNKRTASNSEQQSQRGREQERHCVKLASDVVISNCTEIVIDSGLRSHACVCTHFANCSQGRVLAELPMSPATMKPGGTNTSNMGQTAM